MSTSQPTRVLVVDDDAALRQLFVRFLTDNGFEVQTAANATECRTRLARGHIDIVMLDVMMPGEDGLSVLRQLRASNASLPVLMLSARGDDVDRIVGLELGADDYLSKPCNPREVLARIRALMRRQLAPQLREQVGNAIVHCGACAIDLGARRIVHRGETQALTAYESALLRALFNHPRVPLTRDQLVSLTQGRDMAVSSRGIDVAIAKLRKMIEPDARTPRYLQTFWGVGYLYMPDHDQKLAEPAA